MQTKCVHCEDTHTCHADQDQFFMERLHQLHASQNDAMMHAKSSSEQYGAAWYQARLNALEEVMAIFEQMHPDSGTREWPEIKP